MNRQTSLAALLVFAIAAAAAAFAGESKAPATTVLDTATGPTEQLTLGGGCFWCLEAVYRELRGVTKVESGYAGGHVDHPDYAQVSSGTTGHAEVVDVTFDPKQVSRDDILHVYFTIHDPTTLNRQGNDVGTQYRSGIYYDQPEHGEVASAMIRQMSQDKLFSAPITTEVAPLSNYSTAEAYHQDYFENNPGQGYCRVVIAPKVAKFRHSFGARVKGN